ncbi:SCO7613 C-terminal domain-containing membrane protein [Actinoplanes sp. RD1]|uniref:SCO7613 C-terminal domain-containing membrane protein n=1 Tax=Actinoplanes sp. RD1 TaxID=3064538 RepID=UPI0027408879|nr:hypothetical protein [Actinoplanes sp. RD1]
MTTYPCPFCRAEASAAAGCPGCGRAPDPDAAQVVRLDAEIPVLTARLSAAQAAFAMARSAVGSTDEALRRAWQDREAAAARVRAAVSAAAGAAPKAPAMTAPVTTAAGERSAGFVTSAAAEASTRVMQNTLFLLGGVLLAVAAIVFTAVAWSQFGLRGRVTVLGVGTVVALAAPLVAVRQRLRGTAETFAAVGLLLLLLDGYAAWHLRLLPLTGPAGYAGAVCAVTAAVAFGYAHLTGLAGPRFAALVVAQPVLPLIVSPMSPGAAGWAYTMIALAAADLVVIRLHRRPAEPTALVSYALGALAVFVALTAALVAEATATSAGAAAIAAGALLAGALVIVAGAFQSRVAPLREVAAGLLIVALAIGAGRLVHVAGGDYPAPVLVTLVVTVLAAAVTLTSRVRPAAPGLRGARIGALAVTVLGPLTEVTDLDWRVVVVLVLVTAGVAALVPWRVEVTLTGAALVALAAPAAFGWPWWTALLCDLLVAAIAVIGRLRGGPARGAPWPTAITYVLLVHASLVATRSETTRAALLGVAALACVAGWWLRRRRPGTTSWAAYGPVLVLAFLPALVTVLVTEGGPVRRLLLGLGALAVTAVGAGARLRAPVVAGGVVLTIVALHEVVLVWDLLPRWIPLAAAGLLLVGLAMTLERRRRDLHRVRAAIVRMS